MKIRVTQDDIDNGIKFDACHCPIGRALKRIFTNAAVSQNTISIWINETPQTMDTPIEAKYFIIKFDDGWHVKPFEFDLNID